MSSAAVKLPLEYTSLSSSAVGADTQKITRTISSIADDEVLIKVHYASINPMDEGLRLTNFFQLPLPLTLGFDFSGTIAALGNSGNSNDGLAVGDEVFGVTIGGGCFAEYFLAKRIFVAKRGSLPAKEASTYGIAYLTAWDGVVVEDDLRKRRGQSIYIPGGAGGVGHFAVQLAKAAGLIVYTSGSKPESAALAKKLGVDHYIDYSKQDVVKEILSLTNNRGVDIVWDPVCKASSWAQSSAVVAKGGRWVRLWGGRDDPAAAESTVISRGAEVGLSSLGRYWTDAAWQPKQPTLREALKESIAYYKSSTVRPHITDVIPFDPKAVQAAMQAVFTGKAGVGKLVVEVSKA